MSKLEQFDGKRIPDIIMDRWRTTRWEAEMVWHGATMTAPKTQAVLMVPSRWSSEHEHRVRPGDWIVLDDDGSIEVVSEQAAALFLDVLESGSPSSPNNGGETPAGMG